MPHSVFPQTDRDNSKITVNRMENGKDIPHPGQGWLQRVFEPFLTVYYSKFIV